MCNKWGIPYKLQKIVPDSFGMRFAAQHILRNSVNQIGAMTYISAGVNQRIKLVNNDTSDKRNGADFDDPTSPLDRHTGSFHIYDYDSYHVDYFSCSFEFELFSRQKHSTTPMRHNKSHQQNIYFFQAPIS